MCRGPALLPRCERATSHRANVARRALRPGAHALLQGGRTRSRSGLARRRHSYGSHAALLYLPAGCVAGRAGGHSSAGAVPRAADRLPAPAGGIAATGCGRSTNQPGRANRRDPEWRCVFAGTDAAAGLPGAAEARSAAASVRGRRVLPVEPIQGGRPPDRRDGRVGPPGAGADVRGGWRRSGSGATRWPHQAAPSNGANSFAGRLPADGQGLARPGRAGAVLAG